MTDQQLIESWLINNRPTVCPSAPAFGSQWYRPTAAGREKNHNAAEAPIILSPERATAIAKLAVMFQDLGGRGVPQNNHRDERTTYRHSAYRWFFERSDFTQCCDAAGFDPGYVKRKAKEVWENGLPPTRAGAGQGPRYEQRKRYREKMKAAL